MSARARIHDTLGRLERWLREHQPAFLDAMRPGATDTELDDLERAIGRKLPEDVRAFYRWRGGIGEVACGVGQSPFAGRPMTLSEIRGSYELCTRKAERKNTEDQPAWWHAGWVPLFALAQDVHFLCVDTAGAWTGVRGQIVRFHKASEDRLVLAGSLCDHLRALVISLERELMVDEDTPQLSPYNYSQEHYSSEDPFVPDPQPTAAPIGKPIGDFARVGDVVRVRDGSFVGREGPVRQLNPGTWTVEITLVFWGRPVNIDLEHWQLEVIARAAQPEGVEGSTTGSSAWDDVTDATTLFAALGFGPSVRKIRLFVAAVYRNLLDAGENGELAYVALTRFADGLIDAVALRDALEDFWLLTSEPGAPRGETFPTLYREAVAPELLAPRVVRDGHATPDLIREIFPNPFAPPRFDPAWRSPDVIAVARGIYEGRAFDGLPVLADALQEAGCDSDELLNYLRDTSRMHVRGCWALDLCLGMD